MVITADQLAAELRRVGTARVDTATRRRAEYSTDASLYRVVPAAFEIFVTRRPVGGHPRGSMSGEHGGRARGALLPLMYSERAIAAFEAVRDAFDPDDVLNRS